MSDTLAIAATSAALKFLLMNSVNEFNVNDGLPGDLKVTALNPSLVPDTDPTLNLYFYRATPNPGWMPQGFPSRNADGERMSNPYLSLDLHYLLTAHGQAEFQNEMLLGYGMQVFHENPMLPRQFIRNALEPVNTNPLVAAGLDQGVLQALSVAELAEQIEQLKITHQPASLEEVTNLWSALSTTLQPTAAYQVTVVLIRSRRPARAALPVRAYQVYAVPFRQPVIESVTLETAPAPERIVIRGSALRSDLTRVVIAGAETAVSGADVTNERISLPVPAAARAGINAVQVKHLFEMGDPPAEHRGIESNVAALVLPPRITRPAPDPALEILAATTNEPRRLRVWLAPVVEANQQAELLLNEFDVAEPRAFSIAAVTRAPAAGSVTPLPPTDHLDFPLTGVPDATYLVRVRVAGALSALEREDIAVAPAPEKIIYARPRITLA
jgi:hypothetical protein